MNVQEGFLRGRMGGAVAALPELALAATCLAGLAVPKLAMAISPRMLLTLGLELVAIHAFVPLGGLALLRPARLWTKILRAVAFLAFAVFYSSVAGQWGRDAVISFWTLTFATYFGFFIHDAPLERKRLLFSRWAVLSVSYIAILFAVLVCCDMVGIHSPRRELVVGLVFFGALAAFDAWGVYDRVAKWLPGARSPIEA